MSELSYRGYLITVIQQTNGSYSFTVQINFQTKQQADGFSTEDEALDDACCRIDAILESL